jgi:hypothetical protein
MTVFDSESPAVTACRSRLEVNVGLMSVGAVNSGACLLRHGGKAKAPVRGELGPWGVVGLVCYIEIWMNPMPNDTLPRMVTKS